MADIIGSLGAFIIGALALIFALWLYLILPYEMAQSRGRSGFGWVLVSLVFSPLLAIFLLWIIGDAAWLKKGEEE